MYTSLCPLDHLINTTAEKDSGVNGVLFFFLERLGQGRQFGDNLVKGIHSYVIYTFIYQSFIC